MGAEAGDRALETARKNFERCPDCDEPLEPCGSCPQCGEYPDSPCHKAYLAWDGWTGPAPMWDTFRAGWQACTAESAMNAQERELDLLLPDSLNRPMSERIQGLKERADREARLAVELREALRQLLIVHEDGYGFNGALLDDDVDIEHDRKSAWAEAERLLAESGEAQ